MNKKIIFSIIIIVIVIAATVAWYVTKPDSSTNTNDQTVNSTNVPSNANLAGVPQSEEYIFVFGLNPSTGVVAGGENVTIQGSGFVEGLKVYFGDQEATDVVQTDAKTLTVTTPQGSGTVNVKITNPDGRSGVLYDGFTYN